ARRATRRANAGFRPDRPSRRPNHRPNGSKSKRCRNPDASAWAAASSPRGNSHSDAWPASACRFPPVPWYTRPRMTPGLEQTPWGQGTRSNLREDRRLQVAVMAHQMAHHFQQVGQWLFAIHKIAGANVPVVNDVERFANIVRRVVKAGLTRNFRIVQQRRVQTDFALVRTPSEEVHRAAAAHHVNGPVPGFGIAYGFNGDVGSASARQPANGFSGARDLLRRDQLVGSSGCGP